MSDKVEQKAANSFSYRNIKKDFQVFEGTPEITSNFHLELGEHNETVIVEDRNDDWVEIHKQGVESVGVKNIIEILAKRNEDAFDGRFAYKDSEALDTSMINPMDPEGVRKMVEGKGAAESKLAEIAKGLGVSVDDLVDSFIKGTLNDLIQNSQKQEDAAVESKEEGK